MKRSHFYISLITLASIFIHSCKNTSNINEFVPNEIWYDTLGDPINAHGGGILYNNGKYYWFGEIKKGKTWRVEHITTWECYRVKAGGVSCYSSTDLYNWNFEGVALPANASDSTSDIHTSKV